MADSLNGDPFHEGSSKPMQSMQGGMEMPNTQQPRDSDNQVNPRSAAADNIGQTWNSTSLASTPSPSGTNDKNKAH